MKERKKLSFSLCHFLKSDIQNTMFTEIFCMVRCSTFDKSFVIILYQNLCEVLRHRGAGLSYEFDHLNEITFPVYRAAKGNTVLHCISTDGSDVKPLFVTPAIFLITSILTPADLPAKKMAFLLPSSLNIGLAPVSSLNYRERENYFSN